VEKIKTDYRYRLVNVFTIAGEKLSGNPLCVFEDARGMDDATMQALARQFNLSETTFILPSKTASATVRIFTPAFEMPFAGHPTLGTAHVVRQRYATGDAITLEMKAGVIPVTATRDIWTLTANKPVWRAVDSSREQLAQMLGIATSDVSEPPLWVDTGAEQLVIPLRTPQAVERCRPVAELLGRYGRLNPSRCMAYVWSIASAQEIRARFFFLKGSSIVEDPATGSACANLGGWFIATKVSTPLSYDVRQGDAVGRPSRLGLRVDAGERIQVSGEVIELGNGVLSL
jgi:trans-2,3-dihydro-3-hydroxyanthranilate isomerase